MMDTTLADRLRAIAARNEARSGAQYARLVAFIERIDQVANRCAPGQRAPDFALPGHDNRTVTLRALLDRGPLVLVFVRGLWCPYCREQIAALAASAGAFAAAGVGLAVVTPETGGRAAVMAARHDAPFPVLCDVDMGVALAYGALFPVPPEHKAFLLSGGIDLAQFSGSGAWFMPLPSTFGIGADGTILAVQGGADPRERPDPADILADMVQALAGAPP